MPMRIINLIITGDTVQRDGDVAGVQGSGNVTAVRARFDASWDSFTKTAVWWDARGAEAAHLDLNPDRLEDIANDTRTYIMPIPPEALTCAGECVLIIEGYNNGQRARTIVQEFTVKPATITTFSLENGASTPTQMEQLRHSVDTILEDMSEQAHLAETSAQLSKSYAMGTEDYAVSKSFENLGWGATGSYTLPRIGLVAGKRYIIEITKNHIGGGVKKDEVYHFDAVAERVLKESNNAGGTGLGGEVADLFALGEHDERPETLPEMDGDDPFVDLDDPIWEVPEYLVKLVAGPVTFTEDPAILETQVAATVTQDWWWGTPSIKSIIFYTDGHENARYYAERAETAEHSAEYFRDQSNELWAQTNTAKNETLAARDVAAQSEAGAQAAQVAAETAKEAAEAAAEDANECYQFIDAHEHVILEARDQAVTSKAAAETARTGAETAQGAAEGAKEAAEIAQNITEGVQASLHLRQRVFFGSADEADMLLPGDELYVTDNSSAVNVVTYQTIIWEAQKAAAGQENKLDDVAVLSNINATNWRRNADGHLWTTDTVADFKTALMGLASAATAAGYVYDDGKCTATWAQVQVWLIEGVFVLPLEAEERHYTWRNEAPKTQLSTALEEIYSLKAQLSQAANNLLTIVGGGRMS